MYDLKMLLDTADKLCKQQRTPYSRESRVLLLTCENPEMQPRELGAAYSDRYEGGNARPMTGNNVIGIYKKSRLTHISERKSLCAAAWKAGGRIAEAMKKKNAAVPWQDAVNQLPEHGERDRLLLLSVSAQTEDVIGLPLVEAVQNLGRISAQEFVQTMIGLELEREDQGTQSGNALQVENEHLRKRLAHAELQLAQTREALRSQVEEIVAEEREMFFSKLNDEEYGNILDLLVITQKGFNRLRSKGLKVPMDIRSVQTLTRNMKGFVESYGVEPVLELGEQLEICADDADQLLYEGSPFTNDYEQKLVEVISTGWRIKEKDLVISLPRVRERVD